MQVAKRSKLGKRARQGGDRGGTSTDVLTSRFGSEAKREVKIKWAGEEDSFMDLICKFAKLDTTTSVEMDPNHPESCPSCLSTMPLKDFAGHVMKCVLSIPDIAHTEQKQSIDVDHKIATSLADPEAEAQLVSGQFRPLSECKQGAQCRRLGYEHFIMLKHPTVGCPICAEAFQVYEIDAHISVCLNSAASHTSHVSASTGGTDAMILDMPDDIQGPKLTKEQAQAMSRCVMYQKGEKGLDDSSMLELLSAFKNLGFTRDALANM